MVGIVLVSHSAKIAEGTLELIQQMVADYVPIALAAGLDLPDEEIGTDPLRVLQAIESVYSEDGVLILMDIGSALMSAETALDFLPEDKRNKVYLCEAPIIEGGIAAAVTAAAHSTIEQVIGEARKSVVAKNEQMAQYYNYAALAPNSQLFIEPPLEKTVERLKIIVPNRLGLHMRPAARLVDTVQAHTATVSVLAKDRRANALSINQLVTLGVVEGDEIIFEISGNDAAIVRQKIQQLVDDNFGDTREVATPVPTVVVPKSTGKVNGDAGLHGLGVSSGIAYGVAKFHSRLNDHTTVVSVQEVEMEWQRLVTAVKLTHDELIQTANETQFLINKEDKLIFKAQRLMLQDTNLLQQAKNLIVENHINAEAAWRQAIQSLANEYQNITNEYLSRRAIDVRDLGHRVLTHLGDDEESLFEMDKPHILVARELTPSELIMLKTKNVLGILLEQGNYDDHIAILARAFGIPAVVGLPNIFKLFLEGKTVALNGMTGQVWPAPSTNEIADIQKEKRAWQQKQAVYSEKRKQHPLTKDHEQIKLEVNLNSLSDIDHVLQFEASGVGLCRSEFLFGHFAEFPSEEEQVVTYKHMVRKLGKRPFVMRLFDFGGDKPAAFAAHLDEKNPAFGLRGIRLLLEWPELLGAQLRALLQISNDHTLKILVPMVSTIEEIEQVKFYLEEAKATLRQRQIPFDEDIPLGAMVETPAAVLMLDQIIKEVDFLSLGTNDLTQFIMAAERGNHHVSQLNSSLQPAVLQMIARIAQITTQANVTTAVCGEMANNPIIIPFLIGLGFKEFSMNTSAIPRISAMINNITMPESVKVATEVLQLSTLKEVDTYLTDAFVSFNNQNVTEINF